MSDRTYHFDAPDPHTTLKRETGLGSRTAAGIVAALNVYIFRCMKCGMSYVSDGHVQKCGKCNAYTRQECIQQPDRTSLEVREEA